MNRSSKLTAAAIASAATMGLFAAATSVPANALGGHGAGHGHHGASAKATANLAATAQSTGVHNTLVAAVTAAGLADTLANGGPFTVFAPTDDGFAKLPEGTVQNLLKEENKPLLTRILTYHVVPGKVSAMALIKTIGENGGEATIETLSGDKLRARIVDGTVEITDAKGSTIRVIQTDVMASNGIIHVTDGVFLPA